MSQNKKSHKQKAIETLEALTCSENEQIALKASIELLDIEEEGENKNPISDNSWILNGP